MVLQPSHIRWEDNEQEVAAEVNEMKQQDSFQTEHEDVAPTTTAELPTLRSTGMFATTIGTQVFRTNTRCLQVQIEVEPAGKKLAALVAASFSSPFLFLSSPLPSDDTISKKATEEVYKGELETQKSTAEMDRIEPAQSKPHSDADVQEQNNSEPEVDKPEAISNVSTFFIAQP